MNIKLSAIEYNHIWNVLQSLGGKQAVAATKILTQIQSKCDAGKAESIEIDVEVLFNNFCETIGRFPVNIVGKPYNREANKNKALFVGVLITELKTEKLPRVINNLVYFRA